MHWFLRTLAACGALAALWIANLATTVLPRPDAAQRAALEAILAAPEPAGESNAFPALLLLAWDVPPAKLEAVTGRQVAAYAAVERDQRETFVLPVPYPLHTPHLRAATPPCELHRSDCLDRVRADPAAARMVLRQYAKPLERFDALGGHDHYRDGFRRDFDTPIGLPPGGLSLQLTRAALGFADGDDDAAFADVCALARTWRRLRANTDLLIVDMIGIAIIGDAARLFARMRAERPVPAALARGCTTAFEPLRDAELDQCASMRTEFDTIVNSWRDGAPRDEGWSARIMRRVIENNADADHTRATLAVHFAPFCTAEHRSLAAQRTPRPEAQPHECGWHEWALNPLGCELVSIGFVSLGDYYHRVLDLDAKLRLVAALDWQLANPERAFDERPAVLRSAHHAMEWNAATRVGRVRCLDRYKGEWWELPLASADDVSDARRRASARPAATP